MKARIIGWLRAFASWWEGYDHVTVYIPKDALYQRAVILCALQEPAETAGEAKRRQVYARLLKEFPTRPKRAVAKAIEAAL